MSELREVGTRGNEGHGADAGDGARAGAKEGAEGRIGGFLAGGNLAEAATEGLRAYGPEIGGYLAAVLRDRTAAADVFSDFCEDIWRGIARFRRESSFRTWAYAVAWNALNMYRRDPFRRRAQPLETSDYSRLADRLAKTSLLHADPLAQDRLARLRATLTPFEQSMLILRIDRGLPWREIAEILAEDGTPADPATLRKQFERLKDRLLAQAAREGLADTHG
jgi:RNA polymerase sigma-70 factor, ECF subfamily